MINDLKQEVIHYRTIFKQLANEDPDFLLKELFDIRGDLKVKVYNLYKQLEQSLHVKGSNKGKILEHIVDEIFLSTNMYKNKVNIRDSSNEIDLLVDLNNLGEIESDILPDIMKNNKQIIIECKNYNRKIDVNWVGKFHSLLRNRKKNFGIIFSYYPLKGVGHWDSARGLVKKIYLGEGIAIINITKDDIEKIVKNEACIVKIIEEKYNELVFQTDIEKYISKHPAEQKE